MKAELSPNARRVLEARYLRRDADGRVIETPEELFHRVARAVAQAELLVGAAREADRWQEVFHDLLASLDFLPNSPVLMNAGTPLGQLSACFVLPVEDTMTVPPRTSSRAAGGAGRTWACCASNIPTSWSSSRPSWTGEACGTSTSRSG